MMKISTCFDSVAKKTGEERALELIATGDRPSPKAPIGWLRGHVHSLYSFLLAVHEHRPTEI